MINQAKQSEAGVDGVNPGEFPENNVGGGT